MVGKTVIAELKNRDMATHDGERSQDRNGYSIHTTSNYVILNTI